MVIRTEWHRSEAEILADLRSAGWDAVGVHRTSGLWAWVTLASGEERKVIDGQHIGSDGSSRRMFEYFRSHGWEVLAVPDGYGG